MDVFAAADDVNKLRVLIASRDMREVSDWAIVREIMWARCTVEKPPLISHEVRHGGDIDRCR